MSLQCCVCLPASIACLPEHLLKRLHAGVMMFEMLAGRAPFDGFDDDELFDSILLNKPRYPSAMAKESQAVVKAVRQPLSLLIKCLMSWRVVFDHQGCQAPRLRPSRPRRRQGTWRMLADPMSQFAARVNLFAFPRRMPFIATSTGTASRSRRSSRQ